MARLSPFLIGLGLCIGVSAASDLHVPGDYTTIQAAIDAAVDGDHVVLAPGAYNEAFDLLGKPIVVRSSHGADVTLLDGTGLGISIATAISGETETTTLEGLTFHDGGGTLISNCITSAPRFVGGAIHIRFSVLTVRDCVFLRNGDGAVHEMTAGGAIYAHGGDLAVLNSRFDGNGHWEPGQAGDGMHSGGAVFICGGELIADGCEFSNNGPVGHGGAIRFDSVGDVEIRNCLFIGNSASHGGGINSEQSRGSTTVEDCLFLSNTSSHGGGARVFSNGLARFARCEFVLNEAAFGAGLNLTTDVHGATFPPFAAVSDCRFGENEAGFGAGMFAHIGGDFNTAYPQARLRVENCEFFDNRVHNCCNTGIYGNECFNAGFGTGQYLGGAASMGTFYGPHLIEVINCSAVDNSARSGGAFHFFTCGGGDIRASNNTISGNAPDAVRIRVDSAPSFQHPTSSIEVANSILWGNGQVATPDANVTVDAVAGLSASITYSNVQGGFVGMGNIDSDPLFADALSGDFSLAPGSPCIDAADNFRVASDALDADLDDNFEEPMPLDHAGSPRFSDNPLIPDTGVEHPDFTELAIVDMGAFEHVFSPCEPCDSNCDGSVNQFDIQLFILAIQAHAGCSPCAADANGDGTANTFDINGFIDCLIP